MPEQERVLTPSRSYDIQLTIKDLDYSNDLRRVRVVSSLAGAYQIVTIDLSLDPNDIILENIFGKEPLKLQIKMIGEGMEIIPTEHIKMELIFLDSFSTIPMKTELSEGKEPDRTIFSITTVTRKPYEAMSKKVNDVFSNKTPTEIVTELISETGCELVMDSDEKNMDKIEQVSIPAMSLYNIIKFLDNNFGLYKGASNLGFCQYDNKFYVMNLTKRMNKAPTFTIHHLATDSKNTNEIIEKCVDGKHFYTYTELTNKYSGNAVFASLAKTSIIMCKPTNDLYKEVKFDLKQICKDYGANFGDSEAGYDVDSILDKTEAYVTNNPGYGEGNLPVAEIARKIIGLATLEFYLHADLPILSLLNVGEPVLVEVSTAEYKPLRGKYLLRSSDIDFSRNAASWKTTCHIVIMRTNKSM